MIAEQECVFLTAEEALVRNAKAMPLVPPPPGAGIKWEHTLLTPDLARVLLSKTECNNRPTHQPTVDDYTAQILDGTFMDTHQALGVDEHGCLLDGLHRAEAVLAANTPVWVWIAKNVPSQFFDVTDRGRNRSYADVIAIDRNLGGPEARLIAAATTVAAKYDLGLPKNKWGSKAAFKHSAHSFRLISNRYNIPVGLIEHTNAAARGTKLQKGVVLAASYLINREHPRVDLREFLAGLASGKDITDVRYDFRDHTRQLRGLRKAAWTTYIQTSGFLHMWNAWARGLTLRNFQPNSFDHIPQTIHGPGQDTLL